MSNKVDMRVNRYAKFDNGVEALDDYVNTVRTHGFNTTTAAITAKGDLLARIAELTPPAPHTVDEERLRELVRKWWAEPSSGSPTDELVRRLIDALGYQPAPAPRTVDEERREKAVGIVFGAMLDGKKSGPDFLAANRWLDRITNSLGITVADPGEHAPVVHPCANDSDGDESVVDSWPTPAIDPDDGSPTDSGPCDVPCDACDESAVDVDADTLHTLHTLAKAFENSGSERVEVAIDGTKATLYRNEYAETRVVIGGALL